MWWSRVSYCALSLTFVLGALGCGGSGFSGQDGDDALTMSFQGFSDEGLTQQDFVGNTSAEVDVCPTICDFGVDGIFGDEVFETFTQTHAIANFINLGRADILLESYTVDILRSGLPTRTVSTGALLPSGRCENSPTTKCSLDNDCTTIQGMTGECNQPLTGVEILLFDFIDKSLLVGDATCPGVDPDTGLPIPGTVLPQRYDIDVTFAGSDETGEEFIIKAGLVAGVFDANNCDAGTAE
jgi:hypothetical protein